MSVEISIDKASMNKVLETLSELPKKEQKEVERINGKYGIKAQTIAKQKLRADEHIVVSRLRNSVHWFTKNKNKNFRYADSEGNSFNGRLKVKAKTNELILGTNVLYAEDIEKGRPARTIKPKTAKALAFYPKNSRKLVFAKQVKQKALSGDSFIGYAINKILPSWLKEFKRLPDAITK